MFSSRLLVILSVCCLHIISVNCACQATNSFILRSQSTGLVLDSVQDKVSLQFYTGHDSQLWKFDCAGFPGVYNLLNVNVVKKYLDVDAANSNTVVFAAQNSTSLNQQWMLNGDGTILNLGLQLSLGVLSAAEQAFDLVDVTDNSTQLIKFLLQLK